MTGGRIQEFHFRLKGRTKEKFIEFYKPLFSKFVFMVLHLEIQTFLVILDNSEIFDNLLQILTIIRA